MIWVIIIAVQVMVAVSLVFKAKAMIDFEDIKDIKNFNIFMFVTGLTALIPVLGLVWAAFVLSNKYFK